MIRGFIFIYPSIETGEKNSPGSTDEQNNKFTHSSFFQKLLEDVTSSPFVGSFSLIPKTVALSFICLWAYLFSSNNVATITTPGTRLSRQLCFSSYTLRGIPTTAVQAILEESREIQTAYYWSCFSICEIKYPS